MKAYVLHGIGDYRYEEIQKPCAAAGTVLVHVKAAGICGSDIPRIYRTGAYQHPLIPGHEFTGEEVEAGEGISSSLVGKRVGVFPLIPCMSCPQCQKKQYEMCSNYSYLGSRTNGGFAEYVQVPEWNLIALPDSVTMEQAAMMEPMAVAVHAIRRACPSRTDTIAVCGLGTIGLCIAMFLQEMGCRELYVAGNKDFQRNMAENIGIQGENYCDIRYEDFPGWILDKTGGMGVNIFFDCVGKNDVLKQGIRSLCVEGRMMLVGNPASDVALEKNLYWKILRSQIRLIGTWNSSFTHEENDDWHYVLKRLEEGKVNPEKLITHRMSMESFMEGFEIMHTKSEDYIKIMVLCEE